MGWVPLTIGGRDGVPHCRIRARSVSSRISGSAATPAPDPVGTIRSFLRGTEPHAGTAVRNGPRHTAAWWCAVVAVLALGACAGKWSVNSAPSPVRAVHAALLPNGHVLLIQGSGNDPDLFAAGTFTSTDWNPVTNTFKTIPTPYDMFCGGHASLPDGTLLVAGGTTGYPDTLKQTDYSGSDQAYRYDWRTQTYTAAPKLDEGHWYPTLVNHGDGKVVMVAGQDQNAVLRNHFQIFDPTAKSGTGAWTPQQEVATFFPMYPALHLLADGRFLYSGVTTFGDGADPPGLWNSTTNTFTPVTGLTDANRRDMGASVLLPPAQDQKVLVLGGGFHTDPTAQAVASTAIIDTKAANPHFVPGPPMSESKQYLTAVILPNRTVLQSGGTNESWFAAGEPGFTFRYTAQIYHPDTNTWEDAAHPTVGRTYHSEALLLPDGRVATFGGNYGDDGSPFEMRIEIYTPDYVNQTRPVLSGFAGSPAITRGRTISFKSDRTLKWAELVRPSAATHSNDPDQRLVDLPITQSGTQVTASLDANPNLTPPGYYLLFGVDTNGVPSVGQWVKVS